MAQRATPESYWRAKMQTEVSAPPQQPLPVQMSPPAVVQFPELNSSGLFILGIIAIVGLIGLFALLGSDRKCSR